MTVQIGELSKLQVSKTQEQINSDAETAKKLQDEERERERSRKELEEKDHELAPKCNEEEQAAIQESILAQPSHAMKTRNKNKRKAVAEESLNAILTFSCSLLLILDLTLAVTFDVTQFGAKGNGDVDDSQFNITLMDMNLMNPNLKAFLQAWDKTCASSSNATMVVPEGNTYLLIPLQFNDACKGPSVQVQGLKFSSCKNLELRGLTHINPPKRHINLHSCNQVTISGHTITAPKDSPNTDGIGISSSTNVNITNTIIGTGDDCVAICSGSSNIFVEGVQCGPGHGISVGSLGGGGSQDTVEDVHILNCNFTGTQNGARIKTWQGGKGYARNITFEHIQFNDVQNSIIIDQNYCNGKHDCPAKSGAVEVSNVKYINVQGTSTINRAILLDCSNEVPCNNIVFDNVNITSSSMGDNVYATCKNANVSVPSVVYPVISCSIGDI
ncbi:probable polygalacturonase At3g15720 [Impatiens glandulifera]|uniref:probable polygalacturonase At3g15720 n=1 Tax=Impatiens glandulifera TaxID=253017 RepID=UPI001FB167B2|nr:probable polygalacturonase At3g15720 [Impatiens glandulifera]